MGDQIDQTGTDDADGSGNAGKTFTQDDIQRIIGERVKRAEGAAVAELLKRLGLEKVTDLEKVVSEHRTAQEKDKTEAEKLRDQLAALEGEKQELARQHREQMVKNAVFLEAQKQHVVDSDAAYRLLDPAALTYDEHGNPTNVEQALKDLVDKKPYLVAQQGAGGGSPTNPARGGRPDNDTFTAALLRGAGLTKE